MRRTIRPRALLQLAACVTTLALSAPATASAVPYGGGGTVSPFKVGPLTVDQSSPDELHVWAGDPSNINDFQDREGSWSVQTYDLGRGRSVRYWFEEFEGLGFQLETFESNSINFRSDRGSRVGMRVRTAERHEKRRWRSSTHTCSGGIDRTYGKFSFVAAAFSRSKSARVRSLVVVGPYQHTC